MKKKNISNGSSSGSITQATIDACVADLGRLTSTVSSGAQPLSPAQRKSLVRPRKDGASFARELAQLATKYSVGSVVDLSGMLDAVTQAEQLAPLDKAAANFSVLVHDLVLAANSTSGKSSTTAYTVLKRLARDNPALARDLAGVTGSLKRVKSATTATKSGKPGTATAKTTAAAPEASPEPAAPTEPAATPATPQAPSAK